MAKVEIISVTTKQNSSLLSFNDKFNTLAHIAAAIIAVTAMMVSTPTPFPDTIKVMMDRKKEGKNGAVSQKSNTFAAVYSMNVYCAARLKLLS